MGSADRGFVKDGAVWVAQKAVKAASHVIGLTTIFSSGTWVLRPVATSLIELASHSSDGSFGLGKTFKLFQKLRNKRTVVRDHLQQSKG